MKKINMNLPNKLTMLRVLMIPFFVLFMLAPFAQNRAGSIVAFILFVAASLTDTFDSSITLFEYLSLIYALTRYSLFLTETV